MYYTYIIYIYPRPPNGPSRLAAGAKFLDEVERRTILHYAAPCSTFYYAVLEERGTRAGGADGQTGLEGESAGER